MVKLKPEDLVEALTDPRVTPALEKVLSSLITKSIDAAIDKKLDLLIGTVKELKTENFDLLKRTAQLEVDNSNLRRNVDEQAAKLDEFESYSKSENLIIRGIPEESHAERGTPSGSDDRPMTVSYQAVENTFIKFCRDSLNLEIGQQDISTAHRMKSGQKDSVRPIIVRFSSRRARDAVYRARKILKDQSSNRVYISEHLSKFNSGLFYEARALQRQKKLTSTWTQGGQVFVKFTSDPAVRLTLIKIKSDLTPRF